MNQLNMTFRIDPQELGISYEIIKGEELYNLINLIKKQLEVQHDKPTQDKWNLAWQEVYEKNQKEPIWLTHNNKTIYRWNGNFIKTDDTKLELKYINELRCRVFNMYLQGIDNLIEFGAGSGHNLSAAKELFPDLYIFGTDYTQYAVDLMEKYNIPAAKLDMLNDNGRIRFGSASNKNIAYMTVGAMEQLGQNYENFLNFLLKSNADIFVHIEPIKELYNTHSEFDRLALEYHEKRNYLGNFLTLLKTKNISILECTRTGFGNIYNDGYSVLIWEKQ